MMDYRVETAVAMDDHRVEVVWTDGLSGIVDFSHMIAEGGSFGELRDPARFRDVHVYDYGHGIYWLAMDGSEIDICPDILRAKVDPKAAAWIDQQERRFAGQTAAE